MKTISPLRRACILLVSLTVSSGVFAEDPADQIKTIASALQNREFAQALQLLRPALRASPGNAQLWAMQGAAYAGEGNKQEALASFRNALKISPDYLAALQGAAQIEYDSGSSAAIPVLQHILRLRPGDLISHGMLAVLRYRQGNCPAAASHFEKAGALFNSKIEALHAYATCLVKLRQFDKAASVFQRAVALKPEDRRERQVLASIRLMAHEPQDALAALEPILGSGNTDSATLDLASTAYEAAHDTPQAVNALRQAILLDPQNVNLYLDFANISAIHQSFEVGINVVTEGIGQQPKAAPLYFARGVLYVQLGEYEKAEADFERAYELDPSQSLSAAAQGLAAVQANDLDRALTNVQGKLARKPSDPLLLYVQADILTQKGANPGTPEFQLAMRSAQKSVALQPALGAARGVLAKLYLQTGQYREAVEQCRRALNSDPKDQTALYRLIQALRKTGNKMEIQDLLKRLALLRQQAAKEEREHYRYKLVEEDTPQLSQP